MHTRLLLVLCVLLYATTAQAIPLSDLTTTPSFTDGTFTYSNWTAQFEIHVLDSSPQGFHVMSLPMDDIDVQSTNGRLIVSGFDVDPSLNANNVALNYSYRVSVPDGMELASVRFGIPGAEGINAASGQWTVGNNTLSCISFVTHGTCFKDQLDLSGQSVDVQAGAFFSVQTGSACPPSGCLGLVNTFNITTFTAVPEPSTLALVTVGLLAWAWRQRFVLAGSHVTRKATRYMHALMRTRLLPILFVLLTTAQPAHAVPLSDLVNGGTLTTSNGLTFSNFQAMLTYRDSNPLVKGLITTHQASLADLQLTPTTFSTASGFEVTGFAWEGTVARSALICCPQAPPYAMILQLDYTVTGLGDRGPSDGPGVTPGTSLSLGADSFHALHATAPTGEQVDAEFCLNTMCRQRVAFLPVGTTEATVIDALSISPLQSCGPDFTNCTFRIGGGSSFSFFDGAAIPEPSTLALLLTGLMGLSMARRKK